ncbi:plasma membrane calcium-transporting ATPase [Plectosphaerella plurivora]|uniref:Calcium-transporting ATPase n=1 Tax=Plectosphaerella plurivora TaxID=936078 RepID=A0A9P8VBY4_9PEZI|nr:plasma membrane calcium-transporting ATPase [Plectosphaerella plurivora]
MSDEITAAASPRGTAPPPSSEFREPSTFNVKDLHNEPDNEKPKNNKFAFTPTQLNKLVNARSLTALRAFGGLPGLAAGLRTDTTAGLSVDETELEGTITFDEAIAAGQEQRAPEVTPVIADGRQPTFHLSDHLEIGEHDRHYEDRKRIFNENRLPRRKQKSFLALAWIAFNDKLIFLLSISAVVSLALGIYESVEADLPEDKIQWVDGVTVIVAIIVIVFASAATDWSKTYKFAKLNERKEMRDVKVMRSGKTRNVSVYEVLVGDVMLLETGDVVPVDGVLISGAGVQLDESSITGESELVHKNPARDAELLEHRTHDADPFIVSGTTVCGGIGSFLVIAVGTNSSYGRTLMSLRTDVEETPLQQKLGRLAKQLITFGAIAGLIFFAILVIRWGVQLRGKNLGPAPTAESFFKVLILAVTVVIITVPEGLSLAVTLALAFATKRMLRDKNLVRLIRSCEIMGNATSICSDKTGTLTQNVMTVVVGRIGHGHFGDVGSPSPASSESEKTVQEAFVNEPESIQQFVATLHPEIKELVKNSIALNSTAFETDDEAQSSFVGTSTETALLKFGREHLAMSHLNEERANGNIVTMSPFDASRKWMGVLRKVEGDHYRLLTKGAAEVIFDQCSNMIANPATGTATTPISDDFRKELDASISEYASKMLRPVVIAYRDTNSDEAFTDPDDTDTADFGKLFSNLTFIGVFGIRDPLRPEVTDSVRQCQDAGVVVRMVTGDNFLTAKAIATDCGIYTPGGLAMDGPTFRRLTPNQLDLVIPRLQVLARSSPEDKLLLVSHLKGMGEVVAVTGDGTNDALALKAADVGFAMGIQGTEVAKEAASIILLDDNFKSIVKALVWGRTVNDAVKKFLQFQFTINITAGTLTVVTELAKTSEEADAIFTIVQLLWINLIMDIFASLGLATDYPSSDFLKRKPEPRNAPIVSVTMWKMILLMAIYQMVIIFTLHYGGDAFFPESYTEDQRQTMLFNIYVWMQFFNQHNCRRVDNKINIWYQGVLRNPWFLSVQTLTLAGQMIIIWFGGAAFDTHRLTGSQWGWSLLLGVLVIPLGALIRQIPDSYALAFFHFCRNVTLPIRRAITKPLPERWRPKKKENDMGAAEAWVLQTGAALLRPVNYQWGTHGPPEPTGLVGRTTSISLAQREALEKAVRSGQSGAGDINIVEAIDMAKHNNPNLIHRNIEVHPGTSKEDPILQTPTAGNGKKIPPSQDPEILKWMKMGSLANS